MHVALARRCIATAGAALVAGLAATPAAAVPAQVRDYDLGRVEISDPSPFGPLPVRLWGALGVPASPGPHPLVVVGHGRHGTGCPEGPLDSETWPCFPREIRHDLGLRHVVRALARRGIAAIAPDVNGAYTGGWGEPNDRRRWPRIVNRTLGALARENTEGGGRFPLALRGRLDLRRLGVLGHSLSGQNAVRAARRRAGNGAAAKVAAGRGPIRSLFLLTPIFEGLSPPPGVPFAVAIGTCDGDTGTIGRGYFRRAERDPRRRAPAHLVRLERANHNFFNRSLSSRGADDAPTGRPRCRPRARPSAGAQQRWLARAAADFFAVTLRRSRRPAWLRLRGVLPARLHGVDVTVRRDRAG
jgi:dienelactone hydrolase